MSKEPEKSNPGEVHLDPKAQAEHQDDVIIAPRGTKRGRFLMTFLLVVLVLTTFTVSDQILNVFGGGPAGGAYASWKSPDGETRSLSEPEFMMEKRKLAPISSFAFPGVAEHEVTDEQVATFLVLEQAARESGVQATDKDIAKFVKDNFLNKEQYLSYPRRYGMTGKEFEEVLRRVIRYRRYLALVSAPMAIADPNAVEKRWKAGHQEYSADYVILPVANLETEARAAAPDAAVLRAWYEALPESELVAYRTEERAAAELAALPLDGGFDATRLFAKYPRPEGEDAEAAARDFHAGFSYALYRREKPEQGQDFRKDFDEAKEDALRHAPIYNSMLDWQKDLAARVEKGETPDFAAEAAELGLTYRNQIDPLTRAGWMALSVPWIGQYTLQRVFTADQSTGFFPSIVVDAKGFVMGRVTSRVPPRLPDYSEVTEAVLAGWAREEAKKLALAKLEKVRDALGTRPDPNDTTVPPFKPEVDRDTFLKAVADAGLKADRREFAEINVPASPEGDGPDALFFRQNTAIFTNKVGTVPKAELDRAGANAFLVRIDGVRDPDVSKMTPKDLQTIGMQMASQDRNSFVMQGLMSRDSLVEHYGLHMARWDKDPATP
jgi:hypothetical protein